MKGRIERLKDIVIHTEPEICNDRLRSITASYKETEHMPID